jgi:hypothetical protein
LPAADGLSTRAWLSGIAARLRASVGHPPVTHHLRWRKFSPLDRRYPIYELTVGEELVLDVTRSAAGVFEVRIEQSGVGRTFNLDEVMRLLAEAREMLANESGDAA